MIHLSHENSATSKDSHNLALSLFSHEKLTNFLNTEMKNSKFRLLSTLILSKWFHKLKNMNKPKTKHPVPYSLNTTEKKNSLSESKSLARSSFPNRLNTSLQSKTLQVSPRNSLHMIQSRRKCVYKPSPPSSSSLSTGLNKNKIQFLRKHDSSCASSNLELSSSKDHTKVFDSPRKASPASNQAKGAFKTHNLYVKVNNKEKEEYVCRIQKKIQKTLVSSGRRSSANSPRIKLRITSPRVQVSPRRSKSGLQNKQVLDSFAVIKTSLDPKKDFKESMVEMIKENNIKASKDLEDLLACYLSLNHKEYHDLIVKVFIQVWLEVIQSTFASK